MSPTHSPHPKEPLTKLLPLMVLARPLPINLQIPELLGLVDGCFVHLNLLYTSLRISPPVRLLSSLVFLNPPGHSFPPLVPPHPVAVQIYRPSSFLKPQRCSLANFSLFAALISTIIPFLTQVFTKNFSSNVPYPLSCSRWHFPPPSIMGLLNSFHKSQRISFRLLSFFFPRVPPLWHLPPQVPATHDW